jgi:hypothetical protein
MEEEYCHEGEMCQMENIINNEMPSGDISLKNVLTERRKIDETQREARKIIEIRSNFRNNKRKIEGFFKTNIEEMMGNNKKLIDAREEYRLPNLNYLNSKELCYEMDPFILELVKCKDGSTKVKIIGEDDRFKSRGKSKVLDEEDIIRIRNFEADRRRKFLILLKHQKRKFLILLKEKEKLLTSFMKRISRS